MSRISDNSFPVPKRSSPTKSGKLGAKVVKPSSFDAAQDPYAREVDSQIKAREIEAAAKKVKEAQENLIKVQQTAEKVSTVFSESDKAAAEAAEEFAQQKRVIEELFTECVEEQNQYIATRRAEAAQAAARAARDAARKDAAAS